MPRALWPTFVLGSVLLAHASTSSSAETPGIPVTNDLVRTACGACHASDEEGRMSRISFMRKTPEGWQITIKRMIGTGNVELTPEQARQVLRYLSDHHGLAPEEERPYFYFAEKRVQLEIIEDEETEATCARCHLRAQFATQRRTAEEWKLLKGMHLGYYPVTEYQTFRGASGEDAPPLAAEEAATDDGRWRVDRVLDKLAERYPLASAEWKRFQPKKNRRGLEGRWLFAAHQTGVGPVAGEMTITPSGDDYRHATTLHLADGSEHRREGKGVLYGGTTWRGSSNGTGLGELREVMLVSEDGSELQGRFYRGTFGELGIDVRLTRLFHDPKLAAVWPRSLASGGGKRGLRLMGANFPERLEPGQLDLGQGVRVTGILSQSGNLVEIEVEVADDALPGYRDLLLPGLQSVNAFAVYDRVDVVKVLPTEAIARVGGVAVPKQLAKFEAVAFQRGADDEPLTEDDVELGVVPVRWSLEEYHIRHQDDDIDFVGSIDPQGLFTPNIDGPNLDRELKADNVGDVWVVASYQPQGLTRPVKGRSRLVVTVPLFKYWDLFP